MKQTFFIATLIFVFPSLALCATSLSHDRTKAIETESARINRFFEESFQARLRRHPEFQTRIGIKDNYGKLDDTSEEFAASEVLLTRRELKKLKRFNFGTLNDQAKISYRVFEMLGNRHLERYRYRHHSYPINQMFGVQSALPSFMINMHSIANEQEALDYISRLNAFPKRFDDVIARLKTSEKKGIIMPRFVFPKVLEDSRNIVSGAPFDKSLKKSPLLEDFESKVFKLSIPAKKKNELVARAIVALKTSVGPSYQSLMVYLRKLQKRAPKEGGAWTLPKGLRYYNTVLKHHTTSNFSANQIHQIGLKEVERIHDEMKKIMKTVGFKGDLKAFFNFMKNSKTFKYANTKEGKSSYLKDSEEIISKMNERLKEYFDIQPKASLEVKAVEPYREKSAGIAFYQGPTPDGKRPGRYYVNLYDMNQVAKYEMEALAYHEAIPGHHMQVAISTELKDIPQFRKYSWITAYGEGWALYAELLPKEMGLYEDPYSDFGRLSMELWRACRLVVDTGLHAKEWTRTRGIEYLKNNTPASDGEIVKAVERYIVMPGQATAYKIGMLKILELRENARKTLGKKFDIRKFHNEILKNGAMPLSLLEERIDAWVEVIGT